MAIAKKRSKLVKKPASKAPRTRSPGKAAEPPRVDDVLALLRKQATQATRDGMARYGIPSQNALGVTVAKLHIIAKQVGKSHELALALWDTGVYEARLLATFVDEPGLVTPPQMDRWCKSFDNWAVCDTACFHLFDRTPHALRKVTEWSRRRPEFEKRAAFALLASVAGHDKRSGDAEFLSRLPLVEAAASDERNFVKKALVWALRRIAGRSPECRKATLEVCRRLAKAEDATPRWVGNTTLRELKAR